MKLADFTSENASGIEDRLFWRDGFLRPEQCETIVKELEFAFWQRSKLYVDTGGRQFQHRYSEKRISMTTSERWFTSPLRRLIAGVDRRLARTLPRIHTHREEWQATRYSKGGRFAYHSDSGYFGQELAGERTHTILIYLDTPRRGGVTRFPHLDIDIKSVAGRIAIWSNLVADGRCDPDMIHAGMPISEGRKTTLVTWLRQRECSKANWKGKS